ncbi:tyrosine-type recombinase/integrase [Duganella sp. FT3S]|uniref:Tyrosine-type recombinase/integrase n=1 Tax=Rugamonas fusca TaxID=2758568 RepID=A0A7W2I5G0_9BURK|nr:tyrosine-type recombinase/integrase [Rugamonas fusca]
MADARSEAAAIHVLARQGIDIQVQAEEQRKAERKQREEQQAAEAARRQKEQQENLTFRQMYDAWLADGVRRKNDNAQIKRAFQADVLPKIGELPVRALTENELRTILRTIVERGANRAAVIVRNDLTQAFSWAEKRQPWRKLLIEGNPMELIEIEKIVSPDFDLDNQRDRVLAPTEIRELHHILQQMQDQYDKAPNKRTCKQPLEKTTQYAIWIMLSTLCRVGELTMARWEHIDFNTAKWFIPRQNVKRRVANLDVFLSDFSLEQFKLLHEITGHTPWCFPARDTLSHLAPKSIAKQIGDRQTRFKNSRDGSARKPMKNRRHDDSLVLGNGEFGAWTPHDLRRTGATLMQALGVSLEVIDRCQNHVLPGSKVRRHYLHHDYAIEKRDAWNLLGSRISDILTDEDH